MKDLKKFEISELERSKTHTIKGGNPAPIYPPPIYPESISGKCRKLKTKEKTDTNTEAFKYEQTGG